MLSFGIYDTKTFMALLLKSNTFDSFDFRQGDITTFASFSIDGTRNPDFYPAERLEEGLSRFVSWEEMRPYVFQAVKGSTLPKSIKLVFSLSEEKMKNLPNASAAFLNILFRDNVLTCTTAISQKTFSLDKSEEKLWEEYVLKFFKKNSIGIQPRESL